MNKRASLLLTLLTLTLINSSIASESWKAELKKELPLLGHRNWIVVADSAYPLQTSPGIETITANEDQIKVIQGVLSSLAKTEHVKPTIFTDAEMKFVPENAAPGVDAYRTQLKKLLAGQIQEVLPHEQIIAKLDEAGKTFKILIIKTPLTIPYTSVFFQLGCGYWNPIAEKALRDAMK